MARRAALVSFALAALVTTGAACPGETPAITDAGQDAAPRPDSGPTCMPGAGPATGKVVRVVYLVPMDRTPDPAYVVSLEQAARMLQLWLRARMPRGTSFLLPDPVVEVRETPHEEDWYSTNDAGGAENNRFLDNGLADAFAVTGGMVGDPDNLWLYYLDAQPACGQRNGTYSQVGLFPRNDLLGLVDAPRVPLCGGESDDYPRCRWVGGMALFSVNALGAPRPAGCIDEDDATECRDQNLVRRGYLSFPDAELEPEQLDYLDSSGFVNAVGLPDCELDCNAVPAP
jgi:hypothetical protein